MDSNAINFLAAVHIGQIVTALIGISAAVWAFQKWRIRDEHFPRLFFEVSVNFVGEKDGQIICELVAVLENKGVVPIRYKKLSFILRGLEIDDALELGDERIRNQLNFFRVLRRGFFVPEDWEYSFIYPGVKSEYSYITLVSNRIAFVRMQGDFIYMEHDGESHHAAKVLAVPRNFRL